MILRLCLILFSTSVFCSQPELDSFVDHILTPALHAPAFIAQDPNVLKVDCLLYCPQQFPTGRLGQEYQEFADIVLNINYLACQHSVITQFAAHCVVESLKLSKQYFSEPLATPPCAKSAAFFALFVVREVKKL